MQTGRLLIALKTSFSLIVLLPSLVLFPMPQPDRAKEEKPHTGWRTAVQADLQRREYHVTWQESALFPGGLPGYQAPNRAHNLRVGFYPTGIQVVPRVLDGGQRLQEASIAGHNAPATVPWTWSLALTGLGREETITPVESPAISVRENQVTYRRDLLVEQYTNSEDGLEQRFQIPNPEVQTPNSDSASRVVVELGLIGDLTPRRTGDGQAIEFTTTRERVLGLEQRTPLLRYSLSRATDAAGRQLHTRMEVVAPSHSPRNTKHAIQITTDDSTAAYPITLRLTITALPSSADWIGESDQPDAHLGYALSTAGDVNGDGYSDLIVGAPWFDGGQTDEGAAFVYQGSATGLGSTPSWSAEGNQAEAHLGAAVSIAGDVDGDGYTDVAVGVPDDDGGQTDQGAVLVYLGSESGLTEGAADWTATGDQEEAHLGASVSTAGDVNGDGYGDLIIGAPNYDGEHTDEGAAFVYLGGPSGLTTGTADWTATSDQAEAHLGTAVSTAGDANGDGYADVIVGAPGYDFTGTITVTDAGRVYVFEGGSGGLTAGPADWTATGDQEEAHLGASVSTAGDVNGDGYADVVVGAPDYDGGQSDAGAALAYYGSTTGLAAGTADWSVLGDQEDAHFGAAVSAAGDVNSDGYADVVVGAPDHDDGQTDEGAAFVYLGGSRGLTTGAPGWTATGDQENSHFGTAVSTAGDVNGDGHGDLAIGATGYSHDHTDEGGAFVYHGSPGGLASVPGWSVVSEQYGAILGWSIATAGDVNGDGFADVIVGVPRYGDDMAGEGMALLYTGGPGGPATNPAWTAKGGQAYAWFGIVVASAGDVNNDGYDDVIVGAPHYDGEQRDEGAAFVYHGGPSGLSATPAWIAQPLDQADARFGTAVSAAGDVNGDGYADVVITANGYDGEETNEGAAFVYHGGPDGLAADPDWITHPTDQAYANFGRSASTAGDVNGDGYSDVIVGAPWYDIDQSEEHRDGGGAFVYLGSATGISSDPGWTVVDDGRGNKFGMAVSTAGDVNGDGYSDVIVGAYQYTEVYNVTTWREGAAFVYHGSSTGLTEGTADWIATGGQEEDKFGLAVSTAGDVNGDGYTDVIAGAPNYADGQPTEGVAHVYHGGPAGLAADPAWSTEGNQDSAGYGFAVSDAGDVDGDGYGDIIVSAPTYNHSQIDAGAVFLYLGNGGSGLPLHPRQLRSDSHTPVAALGRSDSANQVCLELTARTPWGRGTAAWQWQTAPLGTPFPATPAISATSLTWHDVLTTSVVLSETVDDLAGGTAYRWRARLLYPPGNPLGQTASRWLYLPWNGPQEADFRTAHLLTPDRSARVLPGHLAVYTHTLTNPISETQTFTVTAVSSQDYTVALATQSGGPTETVAAFGKSPVTVTVEVPSMAAHGTQDTTTVTVTSELSGYDVAHDVTTVDAYMVVSRQRLVLPLVVR